MNYVVITIRLSPFTVVLLMSWIVMPLVGWRFGCQMKDGQIQYLRDRYFVITSLVTGAICGILLALENFDPNLPSSELIGGIAYFTVIFGGLHYAFMTVGAIQKNVRLRRDRWVLEKCGESLEEAKRNYYEVKSK